MVNYAKSVVYKIMSLDPEIDDIYVGSTCAFRKRKHDHKLNCNNENSKEYNRYVYRFIRENCGWDNWSMVVIKAYPDINSKMELLNKERKWMKKLTATLNKNEPCTFLELGTTEYHKQRYEKNKNKILEYSKQRYEKNKNKILECQKQRYEKNKNKILENQKQYYEKNQNKILENQKQYNNDNKNKLLEYQKQYKNDNKEKIKAYQSEKIECECGCMIGRSHIARHIKTKKHIELINQ
jgi:hypothetical protein